MTSLKVSSLVEIKNHTGVVALGEIIEVGGNELNSLACYWVKHKNSFGTTVISKFYVKPELYTGKHLNIEDDSWIENSDEIDSNFFKNVDTGFMVLAALRYCFGRRTYAPGLMTEWVKRYWRFMLPVIQGFN